MVVSNAAVSFFIVINEDFILFNAALCLHGDNSNDGGDSGPSPPPSGQYPPLVVKENGQEKTLYVQYPDWAQAAT